MRAYCTVNATMMSTYHFIANRVNISGECTGEMHLIYQTIGNAQESHVMYGAIIRWRNEAFIWLMFETANWFIMLAHANYVYIQPSLLSPMLPYNMSCETSNMETLHTFV